MLRHGLAALGIALAACASGGGSQWLDYTIDDAAAQKKPLIVEFYAIWCKPCRHFEQHILTDPRVQEMLADFVFVRYDIDTPTGKDAHQRCGGRGIPMVVGIDAKGYVRLLKRGTEIDAEQFLVFLTEARQVLAPQFD